MYPFPAEFDVGQFRFVELEMVCFAANAMNLHFGRKLSLTVGCEFEYCDEGMGAATRSDFPLRSSNLIQLIGSRVTEASVSGKATLVLRFNSGAVLRIHPDAAYESYRIKQDDQEFII